jgi:plasmid stability protein
MSSITLKNIPPDVHEALKRRAQHHGRSLNREIISMLEDSLHAVPVDGVEIGNHARAVRETLGVYVTGKDLKRFRDAGRR